MDDKVTNTAATETPSDKEDLREAVSELNQNIAYLSRMLMQLQRSLKGKKNQADSDKSSSTTSQPTIH